MNFGLAREIYGLNAWCVDVQSLPYLTSILRNIQNGVDLEIPEQKYNSISVYDLKSQTQLITREWQLETKDDFDGIAVINLNGPITKGGGASSYGTLDISNQMLRMANDNRIKGFVLKVDSGGGASNAVKLLSDTINEIDKTKPVYTLVEKGGMMASAAYGIGSAGRKIFAEDGMSIVGSIGTMISFEGKKSNTTDKNGVKNIVLYATKSTEKNKAFEEALNNDNYELIINDLLDPINESFLNLVGENRPILNGTNFDDGHTEFAKNSIGKFIDGIASFDEVVQMILRDSQSNINSNSSLIKSDSKMTKEEFKNSHPNVYASIVSEGINTERERAKSWLAYQKADSEAVKNGIESGNEISASQREELLIKMHSVNQLEQLEQDAAKPIQTNPTAVEENGRGKEVDAEIKEAFNFDLKKN